jgi:prepilin-type N-terminal cleavage/methylation domain-containing protein
MNLPRFSRSYLPLRRGFTLIELMVTIGLILVLLGILLPVVRKVRTSGNIASTQNVLSQLTTAINQYYADFHSYPGPFTNDQIEGNTYLNPTLQTNTVETYDPVAGYGTPVKMNILAAGLFTSAQNITSSENLVLGLLGGLRLNSTAGANLNDPVFSPSEVGQGPLSLNPANPRRYGAYLSSTSMLLWCSNVGGQAIQSSQMPGSIATLTNFTDQSGVAQASDCMIPEFVDTFPNPMPILYLRARTGAKGIISDGVMKDFINTANVAEYQYDLRQISAYTCPNANATGAAANLSIGLPIVPLSSPWTGGPHAMHDLIPINTTGSVSPPNLPPATAVSSSVPPAIQFGISQSNFGQITKSGTNQPDTGWYFNNPSVTPSNVSSDASYNYYGRPRSVDQFILISAGPDGIYGTTDDITSFGDVAQ